MSLTTNLGSAFKTNKEEVENGKWFNLTPDVRLKVRRGSSEKSVAVRRKLESPYAGKVPKDMEKLINLRHVAQGIVCGWEGLSVDDKVLVDYDWKVMEQLLEENEELREVIASFAMDADNFRADTEEQVKN